MASSANKNLTTKNSFDRDKCSRSRTLPRNAIANDTKGQDKYERKSQRLSDKDHLFKVSEETISRKSKPSRTLASSSCNSATTGKSLLQKKDKSALNPKFLNNLFDSSEDKLSRKSRQSRMLASVTSKSGNESKSQVQRRDQPVFDDEFFDESFKLPEEKRSRQSNPSGMSASVTSKSRNEGKSQLQRRDQPVLDDEFFDDFFELPEEIRSRISKPSGMLASRTSASGDEQSRYQPPFDDKFFDDFFKLPEEERSRKSNPSGKLASATSRSYRESTGHLTEEITTQTLAGSEKTTQTSADSVETDSKTELSQEELYSDQDSTEKIAEEIAIQTGNTFADLDATDSDSEFQFNDEQLYRDLQRTKPLRNCRSNRTYIISRTSPSTGDSVFESCSTEDSERNQAEIDNQRNVLWVNYLDHFYTMIAFSLGALCSFFLLVTIAYFGLKLYYADLEVQKPKQYWFQIIVAGIFKILVLMVKTLLHRIFHV